MPHATRANGRASRRSILDHGLALALAGGSHTATIGALASALGMSKSAVFAHFGSKAALDEAILDAAAERFARTVPAAATNAPAGVAHLIALSEGWLAHLEGPLRLIAASEGRADSSGRSRRAAWHAEWQDGLVAQFAAAVAAGELARDTDAGQAAFEMDAHLMAALHGAQLGDTQAAERARRAIEALVLRHSAASGRHR